MCPAEVELACEEDSFRPPHVPSADGCCSLAQGLVQVYIHINLSLTNKCVNVKMPV